MRRIYSVPIFWFAVGMAMLTAFGASALTLALLRWPVATGVLLAAGVSVAMFVFIVQIVTDDSHQVKREPPAPELSATVDGVPVKSVEVMQ